MKKIFVATFISLLFLSCTKDDPADLTNSCIDPSLKNSPEVCSEVRSLVCGCDGNTYLNECKAKQAGVISIKKGACNTHPCIDTSKIYPRICLTIHDPVCGCDGVTYGNDCEAKEAGVSSYLKGECGKAYCIDSTKIVPGRICQTDSVPVCGCNGVTYRNYCEASKNGVAAWMPGSCK